MTDLVDPDEIENIFGIPRHEEYHLLHFQDGVIYIMHSVECKAGGIDLRQCPYSLALDNGQLDFDPIDGMLVGRIK